MSKAEKEHLIRLQGMEYALQVAKERGVEGLEAELRKRSRNKVPLSIGQDELNEFCEKVKKNLLQNTVILFMITLRDELDFGETRIMRVIDRFWKKAECLSEDYTTWDDCVQILADECGIEVEQSKEDLTVKIKSQPIKARACDIGVKL